MLAVENEVCLRRAGDVNPLMIGLTPYQGTHVPRSPQFSLREESFLVSAATEEPPLFLAGVEQNTANRQYTTKMHDC